ncbi:MAG: hypothetical protein Q4C58_05080 [Eubacteriales bacterium]|nr:hypothetical protein [Eubacteriales bacterium]
MRKKSTISWFVFTCVLCLGFSGTTASLTKMLGLSVYAYYALTAALIGAVLLFVYLPIKLLAGKFGLSAENHSADTRKKAVAGIFETTKKISPKDGICLILLMAVLVNVRIFLAPVAVARTETDVFLGLPGLFSGELYAGIVSFLMQFLFETDAVFLCNLSFQVLGVFFLYMGIRLLSGTICAVTTLVFVIYLPVFHNSVYMAEPQSMMLFFFGFLIWICAFCLGRISGAAWNGAVYTPAFIAGLFLGAAAFVNTQLCVLLFLMGSGIGRLPKKIRKKAAAGFGCAVLIGFFLCFGCSVYFFGEGQSLPEKCLRILEGWMLSGTTREYDALLHSPTLADYWMIIPPYLLAFLAVFGASDTETNRGNGRQWIWPLALTVILETLGNAPLQEQGIRFVLLGVTAGYGVRRMFLAESREGFAEEGEDALDERVEKMLDEEKKETEQKGVLPKKPGEYLDNPLPVPKRHVKKEMSYGFEPREDQMFYDVPVSDQDDFDI